MTDKRFLVVGAGTMGGGHARLFASGRVPGASLAGVVDIDLARAQAAAGDTSAYADLAEAIAALKPDAAYVATPDGLHRTPVELLAGAGISILVEKPLATTVADAEAMLAAITAAGVHAEVNFSNRWNPPYVAAKRTVDRGEVGEVLSYNVRLNNPVSSPRDRLSWSAQSSSAWFLMSHCLDLACWLGKKRALSVYATGQKGVLTAAGVDTWDYIHAVVRWEGGGDGVFEAVWVLPDSWPGGVEFNFRLLGSKGAIDVDTTKQLISVSSDRHHFPGTLNWTIDRMSEFVRALDGTARTTVPFEDGVHVTRILVAIHKSLETGAVEAV